MKRLTFGQAVVTVLIAPFFLLAFGLLKLAARTCAGAFVVRKWVNGLRREELQ
jgi:hypothetical protein